MKIKISCTNGKKGSENAGFATNMEGSKQRILDTLDTVRKMVETLPE